MDATVLCEQCEFLWREFAHATAKSAKLSIDRHRVDDVGKRTRLDAEIQRATSERQVIRQRITEHQAVAHPEFKEDEADAFHAETGGRNGRPIII